MRRHAAEFFPLLATTDGVCRLPEVAPVSFLLQIQIRQQCDQCHHEAGRRPPPVNLRPQPRHNHHNSSRQRDAGKMNLHHAQRQQNAPENRLRFLTEHQRVYRPHRRRREERHEILCPDFPGINHRPRRNRKKQSSHKPGHRAVVFSADVPSHNHCRQTERRNTAGHKDRTRVNRKHRDEKINKQRRIRHAHTRH